MKSKERVIILILAGINFTIIMNFMIMMPLQEFFKPDFQISPKQFGALISAYAFGAFISGLSASLFIDRFNRKYALLVAYSGFILGTYACAFASGYNWLMLARIIAGVFGGLVSAQILSIIGDLVPYAHRGQAMGILTSAFSLAAVAGIPVGLFVADKIGWHAPFLGIAITCTTIFPLLFFFLPNLTSHISEKNTSGILAVYRSVLMSRNQQLGLLMMFTLILSHFAIIPFIAPFLEKNVGFNKNQLSLMYFIGGALTIFTSPIIGRLSDKYGKHKIFTIFLLLSVIPIFVITNLPRIPFYYVLMVSGLFFVITTGRMVPAQTLITSVVPQQLRGGFMNLNSSVQQLATGLAAFMGGSIVTENSAGELVNYQIVGYAGIGISLFCLLISRKVKVLESPAVTHFPLEPVPEKN